MKTLKKKKENKVEDNFYRLQEMYDSMQVSLGNIVNVIHQQEMLIEVVEKSDKKDEFEKFTEDLKSQIKNLQSQYDKLSARASCLKNVFVEVEDTPEKRTLVNNLLSGLGVFDQ